MASASSAPSPCLQRPPSSFCTSSSWSSRTCIKQYQTCLLKSCNPQCVTSIRSARRLEAVDAKATSFNISEISKAFQYLNKKQYMHCFLGYWIWKYNIGMYCWYDFALSCLIQIKVFTRLKIQRRKCTKYDVTTAWCPVWPAFQMPSSRHPRLLDLKALGESLEAFVV